MANFSYTAIDAQGRQSSGSLSAENRSAAIGLVITQGLTPVTVEECASAQAGNAGATAGRVPLANVEAFTREMANLLGAGVPLSRALNIVIRETSHPAARAQWAAVHDSVVAGSTLVDALAQWPKTFGRVYVAMVRAGETGGFLDVVLSQISEFQAREQELKGKVKAALVYPAVLAALAVLVLVFLLTYFIPKFSLVFHDFGGNLPALTQAIVGASELAVRHGVAALAAVAALLFAGRQAAASESGRRACESLAVRAPLLGMVIARFALVRFFRMLGTLLCSGVGLINALKVAKEAIGNQSLSDTVGKAVEEVRQGASLSKSLSNNERLFPPSVVEMVAVAEETGRSNDFHSGSWP